MSNKPSPRVELQDEQADQPEDQEEVLLRDESDEIIDTLKQRLRNLEAQLAHYRGDEGAPGGPGAGEPAGRERPPGGWGGELVPHIAARLQVPAEELTGRLDALIERTDDPALRAELEHCRDTAFFLFDTFREISDKHAELTESLAVNPEHLEVPDFLARLEAALTERRLPVSLRGGADLPPQRVLAAPSVITVLTTLAAVGSELLGETARIELAPAEGEPAPGAERVPLRLRITGEQVWEGLAEDDQVTSVAIRAGMRSAAVVDLLYVEKIIEMQGGAVGFYRDQGQVHGFEVLLPAAPSQD